VIDECRKGAKQRLGVGAPKSSGLKDLDEDEGFFVQATCSDLIERLGWGKEKDDHPSKVVRTRRGQAYGGDPALVDRSHTGQIEADRSSGTDAGYRLEQLIGILGQQSTEKSQCARSENFDLHLAIVGRLAAKSKAANLGIGGPAAFQEAASWAKPSPQRLTRRV
jgi:hypothetical protein